jgi:hypothetical protein
MTAAQLLAGLRRRGAILQVVSDRLRVDAPVGVVTAADRAALAEHKAELLAMLGSSIGQLERVGSDLQGAARSGFLLMVRHAHVCTTCFRQFRCTAPSCAEQSTQCISCKLDRIEGRGQR